MSVAIWPPISPEELKTAEEDTQVSHHHHPPKHKNSNVPCIMAAAGVMTWPIDDGWVLLPSPTAAPSSNNALTSFAPSLQRRELEWLLDELHETLQNLKHGLENCYALLAPVDPGSTLVVSTPRNELVKGHVTRVGTRIVKGTLHLRMRTLPPQTLAISPDHPIHIAPLTSLHTLLTESIDLLTLTLSYTYPSSSSSPGARQPAPDPDPPISSNATFIAAQLRLLSQSLSEASALLKGPQPLTASDANWKSQSCSPVHFVPQPGPNMSVHWGIQDSSLILWLRALEPVHAPVNLGLKFALAIGTARRLEHDEADQVFTYTYPEGTHLDGGGSSARSSDGSGDGGDDKNQAEVYVREKVRVESADPSLMSLSAKLGALGHTLSLARRNLAAVMGEEIED